MTSVLILVIILAAVVAAVVVGKADKSGTDRSRPAAADCATCDGTAGKCEQTCMMEAATRDIVYFDDEELDRFKGRSSDSYLGSETEQFAEVLFTLRPSEVKDWLRSLTLRGIQLPDMLKDDAFLMAEDPLAR